MQYYKRLDGLRALALLGVFIDHFAEPIGRKVKFGYWGVDLFFVISGFLITSILLKYQNKPKSGYLNFLARRSLRIFPIYFLSIALFWLIGMPSVRENILWLISYTFNYGSVLNGGRSLPIVHFWTLSVEEQFYLVWPIFVLFIIPKRKHLIYASMAMLAIGYLFMLWKPTPFFTTFYYVSMHTRMASLALGALAALLGQKDISKIWLLTDTVFEYIVIACGFYAAVQFSMLSYPVIGITALFLVVKAAKADFSIKPLGLLLDAAWLQQIGRISYGMYIFHLPLGRMLDSYFLLPFWHSIDFSGLGWFHKLQYNPWLIGLPLYSVLTYILAKLSYKYIEQPILKLKDRWFASPF